MNNIQIKQEIFKQMKRLDSFIIVVCLNFGDGTHEGKDLKFTDVQILDDKQNLLEAFEFGTETTDESIAKKEQHKMYKYLKKIFNTKIKMMECRL